MTKRPRTPGVESWQEKAAKKPIDGPLKSLAHEARRLLGWNLGSPHNALEFLSTHKAASKTGLSNSTIARLVNGDTVSYRIIESFATHMGGDAKKLKALKRSDECANEECANEEKHERTHQELHGSCDATSAILERYQSPLAAPSDTAEPKHEAVPLRIAEAIHGTPITSIRLTREGQYLWKRLALDMDMEQNPSLVLEMLLRERAEHMGIQIPSWCK